MNLIQVSHRSHRSTEKRIQSINTFAQTTLIKNVKSLSHFEKIEWPPNSTNLNSFHQKMLCAKFGWNWPSGSGEDFFNVVNAFLQLGYHLPLGMGVALHLNKVGLLVSKNALCQVWLKLSKWFQRRSKCEKLTDGQMDDKQQTIRKVHLSFQLKVHTACALRWKHRKNFYIFLLHFLHFQKSDYLENGANFIARWFKQTCKKSDYLENGANFIARWET